MCGLFLCEIIKGFHHYARILIFLSCFGIYSDFSSHVQIHRLEYYYDPADYNKVIYQQRKEDYSQRLQTILFLVRAFSEQVIKENNTLRLKNKEDGTWILQCPAGH